MNDIESPNCDYSTGYVIFYFSPYISFFPARVFLALISCTTNVFLPFLCQHIWETGFVIVGSSRFFVLNLSGLIQTWSLPFFASIFVGWKFRYPGYFLVRLTLAGRSHPDSTCNCTQYQIKTPNPLLNEILENIHQNSSDVQSHSYVNVNSFFLI